MTENQLVYDQKIISTTNNNNWICKCLFDFKSRISTSGDYYNDKPYWLNNKTKKKFSGNVQYFMFIVVVKSLMFTKIW